MGSFKIDPIILLLLFGMLIFSVLLIYCEHMFKDDAQIFQVFASLVTGFGAALWTRIKPGDDKSKSQDTNTPTDKT